MDAIQSKGLAGDPTEVANKLLASSMAGDSSGFDGLIRAAQSGEDRARALQVPAACAELHRKTLALLHDGTALTRSLQTAIGKQDADALTSLAVSASSLQSRAEALEQEEKAIKTKLGLVP